MSQVQNQAAVQLLIMQQVKNQIAAGAGFDDLTEHTLVLASSNTTAAAAAQRQPSPRNNDSFLVLSREHSKKASQSSKVPPQTGLEAWKAKKNSNFVENEKVAELQLNRPKLPVFAQLFGEESQTKSSNFKINFNKITPLQLELALKNLHGQDQSQLFSNQLFQTSDGQFNSGGISAVA